MDVKKASVEGRMSDVISLNELEENRQLYESGPVCVEVNNYVLPYRQDVVKTDRPGVYKFSDKDNLDLIIYPKKSEEKDYKPEVIDFSNTKSMQDYLSKKEQVRDIEREILTSPDNIFRPHINEDDTPEMKGLKEAIINKHIDIDKYADRFGPNFPNDKRKMRDNKITLFLLKRMCEGLDMKAELIISDAGPNVPNPIGDPVRIELTSPIMEDDNGDKEES